MAVQVDGIAPYAPPQAVVAVLDFDRKRGIPTPITPETIERIGVSSSLAPRTHQALRLLDLLDDDGMPTEAMTGLRKATAEDYPHRLEQVLKAAYAEVFKYVDPAEDDPERVRDAFRHFTPVGMQERMVTLFLGLCAAAGIIEEAPKRRGRPPKIAGNGAKPQSKAETTQRRRSRKGKDEPPPPPPPQDAGGRRHPDLIEALIAKLPQKGESWTAEGFEYWIQMMQLAAPVEYDFKPKPRTDDA